MENNIEQTIKTFLEKETGHTITDSHTNFIETGVVDSFSMIKLIGFIEEHFGMVINMEELSPENFYSLESITAFVQKLSDVK